MRALVSDRQVTIAAKAFTAVLVVVTTAATGGAVATTGLDGAIEGVPALYVATVLFLGVWSGQLTTYRYNRALLVGFLALVASLWDTTAVLAPVLILPGIAVLLWPAVASDS